MPRKTRSRVPLVAAIATLAIHLAGNSHYGFLRDEIYFIICGFRPDWGYVDQAPVVPLLSAGTQLLGHSLFALRAVSALFAAASVYTTCLLVEEFDGGVFAEFFAAVVAAFTPLMMGFGTLFTTETVGLWLWPLTTLLVVRIVKGADPRWWLAVGAIVGIALESKYSALFFSLALAGGLLLVPARRVLFTKWFLLGTLIAVAIAMPTFLWQATHGFPEWTLLHDADETKNTVLSPPLYLGAQVLITNPLIALVWLIGLVTVLRRPTFRFVGFAYFLLIAQMIVLHAKHYYPGNVYPILIAAGAVTIEAWTARAVWVRTVAIVYVFAAGIVLVPFVMPVLPERAMSAYDDVVARIVGGQSINMARTDRVALGTLPPDWQDMHGWPELTAQVAQVYYSLPPREREQAAIYTKNYGEAAAIDYFGGPYRLPPAISGNDQYFLWGARGSRGEVVIDVNGECFPDAHLFRSRRVVARFSDAWARPFENNAPISICEGITTPLSDYWPNLRSYI